MQSSTLPRQAFWDTWKCDVIIFYNIMIGIFIDHIPPKVYVWQKKKMNSCQ